MSDNNSLNRRSLLTGLAGAFGTTAVSDVRATGSDITDDVVSGTAPYVEVLFEPETEEFTPKTPPAIGCPTGIKTAIPTSAGLALGVDIKARPDVPFVNTLTRSAHIEWDQPISSGYVPATPDIHDPRMVIPGVPSPDIRVSQQSDGVGLLVGENTYNVQEGEVVEDTLSITPTKDVYSRDVPVRIRSTFLGEVRLLSHPSRTVLPAGFDRSVRDEDRPTPADSVGSVKNISVETGVASDRPVALVTPARGDSR